MGFRNVSYSVSGTCMLVIATGRIRNVPQKNRTVDSFAGGNWDGPEPLPNRLIEDDCGSINNSRAESMGNTPLARAMGLPAANCSVASRRKVKLKVSEGWLGCCSESTLPLLSGDCGGVTKDGVRLTCAGLNWKTTMLGRAPRSFAPNCRNAPFKAAIYLPFEFVANRRSSELQCQHAQPRSCDTVRRLVVCHRPQVDIYRFAADQVVASCKLAIAPLFKLLAKTFEQNGCGSGRDRTNPVLVSRSICHVDPQNVNLDVHSTHRPCFAACSSPISDLSFRQRSLQFGKFSACCLGQMDHLYRHSIFGSQKSSIQCNIANVPSGDRQPREHVDLQLFGWQSGWKYTLPDVSPLGKFREWEIDYKTNPAQEGC